MSEAATAEHPTQQRQQRVKGRKDTEGQPAVIDITVLHASIDGLVDLKHAMDQSVEEFDSAVGEAAKGAGLLASVVRKFVVARASKDYAERKRKHKQLELCFTDIDDKPYAGE